MAYSYPYTYISCPCSDSSRRALESNGPSQNFSIEDENDEEEKSFDPRHPRSAFSLFPPEHLLYCEECHDIKCPRCVTEEIICWYCPSCLFEMPSASVRSEGNRCARNCFNCPICQSQLITASIGSDKGPFILNCNYCMWTTLDIGITFEKATNIRAQLDRIANGGGPKQPSKSDAADVARNSSLAREHLSPNDNDDGECDKDEDPPLEAAARFNALRSFYKEQITSSTTNEGGLSSSTLDLAYSSPSSLARIMNLYSNLNTTALKKSRQKPSVMREALAKKEGLQISAMSPTIPTDYTDTSSISQQSHQHPSYLGDPTAKAVSSLRPMPALLRTKRSKRCATCKHILVKPESKASSTRHRIKLIALNYLPSINLKPLPTSDGLTPAGPDGQDVLLQPGHASQWILTLRNPLFENVKVTLASPSVTPGRHAHKVIMLCPQFEIGKNGDVWDDALNPNILNKSMMAGAGGGEQIAGKLYDQGRNWVSVVIELVPTAIVREARRDWEEDEEIIEVPVRVRLEWKVSEEDGGDGKKKSSEKLEDGEGDDGRREVAYWMVLGVGRVAC